MATTAFIFWIKKVSLGLKSLMVYLITKIDDVHFWGEQLFFKMFMLHDRLATGDSMFSSIYAVVMKALIPSYPEVLGDTWSNDFENLYHVSVPPKEYDHNSAEKPKQELLLTWTSIAYRFTAIAVSARAMVATIRNDLHLLQKEVYGQLEFYKENFK